MGAFYSAVYENRFDLFRISDSRYWLLIFMVELVKDDTFSPPLHVLSTFLFIYLLLYICSGRILEEIRESSAFFLLLINRLAIIVL